MKKITLLILTLLTAFFIFNRIKINQHIYKKFELLDEVEDRLDILEDKVERLQQDE